MKKFKLIGLIMMALLLIGGCGNQKDSAKDSSSTSSTKEHSSSKVKAKKSSSSKQSEQASESSSSESTTSTSAATSMNFDEISSGNYSSLLGDWKIVATSGINYGGSQGDTWHTPNGTEYLDVTSSQIFNGDITLQGTNLATNGETGVGTIKNEDGFLDINGQAGVMICSFSFYPKGVPNDGWGDDVPTSIDINKDRIFVRTSNNHYTEVFER